MFIQHSLARITIDSMQQVNRYAVCLSAILQNTSTLALPTGKWFCHVTVCCYRYKQVSVDGAYWREHGTWPAHQGSRLLHAAGRVPYRQGWVANTSQLPYVQDVLLPVWICLHWARLVCFTLHILPALSAISELVSTVVVAKIMTCHDRMY